METRTCVQGERSTDLKWAKRRRQRAAEERFKIKCKSAFYADAHWEQKGNFFLKDLKRPDLGVNNGQ